MKSANNFHKNQMPRRKRRKIVQKKITNFVIILPSVKLLNPSFTNDVLNTAAIYGSLKWALSYVLKLLYELVDFFLKDAFTFTAISL